MNVSLNVQCKLTIIVNNKETNDILEGLEFEIYMEISITHTEIDESLRANKFIESVVHTTRSYLEFMQI